MPAQTSLNENVSQHGRIQAFSNYQFQQFHHHLSVLSWNPASAPLHCSRWDDKSLLLPQRTRQKLSYWAAHHIFQSEFVAWSSPHPSQLSVSFYNVFIYLQIQSFWLWNRELHLVPCREPKTQILSRVIQLMWLTNHFQDIPHCVPWENHSQSRLDIWQAGPRWHEVIIWNRKLVIAGGAVNDKNIF